jgi:transglutaminase-like putative cysteine protease
MNPARHRLLPVFALLLLACMAHAATFGYSRITLHRTWEVTSDAPFDFTGALAVNDSTQRVVSVRTEPAMNLSTDENGTIMLHYSGNGTVTLKADALVDIDFDPVLSADQPVPGTPLPSSNLTQADAGITNQAHELVNQDSSLETIRDLVNWVHGYMTYDISYWGKSKSAAEAYQERRGVCVEYTHLLISLARSLGYETRYVSGYVRTTSWQPHAWAEILVPDSGWVAVDPTFAQAGVLDSSHLAVRKSDDQSVSYDLLLSQDEDVDIRAVDSLETGFEADDPKGASVAVDIDKRSLMIGVTVANSRPDFLLGSYSLSLPDAYGGGETSVLLLKPNENLSIYHSLNRSLFEEGLFYTVPVAASFNDASGNGTLDVDMFLPPDDGGQPPDGADAGLCGQPALLLAAGLLCAAYVAKRKR